MNSYLILITVVAFCHSAVGNSEVQCPANEHLETCPNLCKENACDKILKTIHCPDVKTCVPACVCDKHHWRNSAGKCVRVEECPPIICTEENTEYNSCPSYCLDQTCKSIYNRRMCALFMLDLECRPECLCKRGFLTDINGKCIPEHQCPCPTNQHMDLCANKVVEKRCFDIEFGKFVGEQREEPSNCHVGCVCDKHYWRYGSQCVKVNQCPPKNCTSVNGIYSMCPPYCSDYSCESIYRELDCPPNDDPECEPRCICREGLLMNADGICVDVSKCPEPTPVRGDGAKNDQCIVLDRKMDLLELNTDKDIKICINQCITDLDENASGNADSITALKKSIKDCLLKRFPDNKHKAMKKMKVNLTKRKDMEQCVNRCITDLERNDSNDENKIAALKKCAGGCLLKFLPNNQGKILKKNENSFPETFRLF